MHHLNGILHNPLISSTLLDCYRNDEKITCQCDAEVKYEHSVKGGTVCLPTLSAFSVASD